VVLTPTTATPPPKIGAMAELDANGLSKAMVRACPYAWPWNTLGWPAINVPTGTTDDGIPLGAQLLGPADSEELLISLPPNWNPANAGRTAARPTANNPPTKPKTRRRPESQPPPGQPPPIPGGRPRVQPSRRKAGRKTGIACLWMNFWGCG
jgi:amidase